MQVDIRLTSPAALKALGFQLVESTYLSSQWFQFVNLHPYTQGAMYAFPSLSLPSKFTDEVGWEQA